jgi:hypothetical protein
MGGEAGTVCISGAGGDGARRAVPPSFIRIGHSPLANAAFSGRWTKPFSITAIWAFRRMILSLTAPHMPQVRLNKVRMSCVPEALRESVRELMDPADGPNGEKVALSDA